MFQLILVVIVVGFDLCNAQTPPSVTGTARFYSGHGGFSTGTTGGNCPITDCSVYASTACIVGQYLSGCGGGTVTGSCISCSGAPANAEYTTNGGLIATGCQWRCLTNYENVGGVCTLKQCASVNSGALSLPAGIANIQYASDANGGLYPDCKYVCMAGYSGVTAPGDRGPSACTQCAAGTAAQAGSSACTSCGAGFYAAAGASLCSPCPQDTFAPNSNSASCTGCQPCATGFYKSGCGPVNAGTCSSCGNTGYISPPQI